MKRTEIQGNQEMSSMRDSMEAEKRSSELVNRL